MYHVDGARRRAGKSNCLAAQMLSVALTEAGSRCQNPQNSNQTGRGNRILLSTKDKTTSVANESCQSARADCYRDVRELHSVSPTSAPKRNSLSCGGVQAVYKPCTCPRVVRLDSITDGGRPHRRTKMQAANLPRSAPTQVSLKEDGPAIGGARACSETADNTAFRRFVFADEFLDRPAA